MQKPSLKSVMWSSRNLVVVPLVGLFMAASLLVPAHPALAQAQQQACPLPAGLTPPADPPVTAQQVEDGSATLREFALAVRNQHRTLSRELATFEGEAYFGCLIRQDGSPYRSGSTFLVSLAADRVVVHSKAMALSGRKLNPRIYGTILRALGARKFTDLIAAARSDGRSFNVPDIPGASGYATVYMSPGLGIPVVLLAGFDLNSSHLVSEPADDAAPAVTARDVVDRETLKAFVTGAGEYLLELARTGGRNAIWSAKDAMRDPDGPWRHGSVYLYVLDLSSNLIMFHGAFPDRYEFRPLIATVRDTVTGELVLPQVIEAAKSSPEGGFVQYFFDDPTDDNDSADIPKVGYARVFTGPFLEPGNRVSRGEFIVGSGFYGRAPDATAMNRNTVVESVLPQVMRAMTASTVDAISGRVRQAASGAPSAGQASLGGASTLTDALMANRQALEDGTLDPVRLLANSSFVLPLNAADGRGSGPFRNLTVWGSGDWRSFSGGNRRSVAYDGNVASGSLGIDTGIGGNLLAGLSVARARGSVDYTGADAQRGELTATLTSVNPYVGWWAPGGMSLWAAAGHGAGEVEIEDSAGTETSDLTQQMISGGLNVPVATSDRLMEGGTVSLSLKAETAFTWVEVDASGTLASAELSASRHRLTVEGSYARKLESGGTLTPSIEIGMRNDGGDGETGSSVEAGGALRYADPATGLSVEGRARTLLVHGEDYREWGLGGLIRIDPGSAGRGLALSVQPAWGQTTSGVRQLWETGVAGTASPAYRPTGRMDAEIGYGLAAPGGLGTVTPYAGLGLAGEDTRSWRMGAHWRLTPTASVSLEGARHEAANDAVPEHGLMLRGTFRW